MDRRKSISLIGVGSLLLTQNAFPSVLSNIGDAVSDVNFMKAFSARWEGLRMHTFEVFEAMPDAQLGFKLMSYAKLFSHIAVSMDVYAEILDGTPHKKEVESVKKEIVLAYLQTRFERLEAVFNKLNPTDLYSPIHISETIDGKIYSSDYDILMLAFNHTVHHKGQATTYLRLKGIVPPQYRF